MRYAPVARPEVNPLTSTQNPAELLLDTETVVSLPLKPGRKQAYLKKRPALFETALEGKFTIR